MDRTELAWAAGFFDGEGWAAQTRAAGRRTGQPRAQVNQSSRTGPPEVLDRFRRAVGVGVVGGPALEEGRLPRYWWVVSSREDVAATREALWTWLGPVKRREFMSALGLDSADPLLPVKDREESLAWAAGLFDGEGCVYLAKHRSHPGYARLETAITQSDPDGIPHVLTEFQRITSLGFTKGPYPAPPGHDPVYRWKLYRAQEIERMIEGLWPWLGTVKREQARHAITTVRMQQPLPRGNPAWGNRKTHCVKGHEYATARIRPFRSRGKNTAAPRASHQCLACVRDHARRKRIEKAKLGG